MPILTARRVTKRFGGLFAVSALDFEIEKNAIVSVIGPKGSCRPGSPPARSMPTRRS